MIERVMVDTGSRARMAKVGLAQLSAFANDIRERLELLRLGGAADCTRLLDVVRPYLEDLADRGGDPRFALGVMAGARWRRLRPPGERFPEWIRMLERLSHQDDLYRLIGQPREPRAHLRGAVADALTFLRSFGWQDEGIFESRGTRARRKTPRWGSRHTDRATAVLHWHLRTGTKGRWDRLSLLATLLQGFELIKAGSGEDVPVETVKKRIQRLHQDYFLRFVIPIERLSFHEWHIHLGQETGQAHLERCGTACVPERSVGTRGGTREGTSKGIGEV